MRAIVEENFDMADYADFEFGVSVAKSSSLTVKETQTTVCDVGEQADAEDEGLTEEDGEEFSK